MFYCDECREPLTDRKILDGIVDLFRRAHRRHLVRAQRRRAAAAGHEVRQVRRRGIHARRTTFSTCGSIPARATWPCSREDNGLPWPADLYLEGGDQYRGWFHSSLLVGTGLKGGSPYRACALNGWVLDGEGRAMHKSLGNTIEPEEIIKQHGAEMLRLWAASVEFNEDVRISETILDAPDRGLSQAAQHVPLRARQPRRTSTRRRDAVAGGELQEIDQWILLRAEELVARCRAWYDEFAFHKVYQRGLRFRHRRPERGLLRRAEGPAVHVSAAKSQARRSAQTALYRLAYALVRLVAPILTFTAEEVWTHLRQPDSVHMRATSPSLRS